MTLDASGEIVGVARVSALTSGTAGVTTQDITDSNFGDTPNAVRLFACLASANNTVADGAVFAYGMSDGTDSGCVAIWSEDQTGTANANCGRVTRDRVMHLPDDAGTIVLSLSFDSFISDGVRVTYETIPGTAYYIVAVFYKATTAKVGYTSTDATIGNKVDITTVGAQPNVMHFASVALAVTTTDTTGTHGAMSIGLAVDNGTTLEFGYKLTSWKDNVATTECGQVQTNTAICGTGLPAGTVITASSTAKIVDLDASGFSFETVLAGSNKVLWMALEFATADVELIEFDTGNIVGDVSNTEASFGPQFVECIMSEMNGSLGSKTDVSTGPMGMGFATADNEFSVSACHRDGQTIPSTGSLVDTQFHVLRRNVVATTGMQASGPSGSGSFDVDGFTLNFSSEVGGNKDWLTLVIQERATVASAPLGALAVADLAPVPATPVETPLGALAVADLAPVPATPVETPLGTAALAGILPDVVTPVETPLGTLAVADLAPVPATPVETPLGTAALAGILPDVVTPVETPLGTAALAGILPDVVTPVEAPLGTLISRFTAPKPATPIELTLGVLTLADLSPVPNTPVELTLGVLTLLGIVPVVDDGVGGVETLVSLPLGALTLADLGTLPNTPVEIPLGTIALSGFAVDIVTPINLSEATLTLSDLGTIPVTSVEIPLGALTLADLGTEPVIPVESPLGGLALLGFVPVPNTPIELSLTTIRLGTFGATIEALTGAGCYEITENNIRSKLHDSKPGISIAYDNSPFDAPNNTIWASFQIDWENTALIETGVTHRYRKFGVARFILRSPIGTGDQSALEKLDTLKIAFRLAVDNGVGYGIPSVRRNGASADSWVNELRIPFYLDEVAVPTFIPSGSGMPDSEATANIIRSRFKTQVADAETVEVQYDNAPFDAPNDTLWIQLSILPGDSILAEIGETKTYRNPGVAIAAIYAPVGIGTKSSLEIADVINAAFRATSDSGVTFRTPSVKRIGRTRDGNSWQTNVSIPFFSDEQA
jgi:hypothetical protein